MRKKDKRRPWEYWEPILFKYFKADKTIQKAQAMRHFKILPQVVNEIVDMWFDDINEKRKYE